MPSVIRLVYMLRRKPGLSLEEFHRVWRDEHGPLVAFHQVRLGILRYTQSHRLDDPSTAGMTGARGMKPPLRRCGRSVVGVGGGADRCVGERRRQRAAAEVAADEAGFIDLPSSPLWLAHEYPQVNPGPEPLVATPKSPLVKLHYPLRLAADPDVRTGPNLLADQARAAGPANGDDEGDAEVHPGVPLRVGVRGGAAGIAGNDGRAVYRPRGGVD